MGWAFLLAAFLILTLNPRVYYLFPAFPMVLASGSAMWERWDPVAARAETYIRFVDARLKTSVSTGAPIDT